jgi:transmembrane sensor
MNPIQDLAYLYQRYKDDICTPAERKAFMEMVRKPQMAAALKALISKDATAVDEGAILITKELSPEKAEELFQFIIAATSATPDRSAIPTPTTAPVLPLTSPEAKRRRWWPAAAAVLLLLAGAGTIVFNPRPRMPVAARKPVTIPQNDVLPGGNKARLTLSNGSVIILDSAANGLLAEQGNSSISKLKNGQLAYKETRAGIMTGKGRETLAESGQPASPKYNTLSTPRGGQYQLMLPDGTNVWLNAASSITYPTSFTGVGRRITMTGEAYFEVAKMSHSPFIVVANGTEIEALGTHFNVNAYKEDPAVLATLLEGSIRVSAQGNQQMVRPGEQAVITPSATGIGLNMDIDLDEVVAWKNGYFQFDHADIQSIMRQVARWYDVEISYEGKIPERKFGGDISRDLKLSEVLYGLNLSKVHFRIEGKRLVILP